MQCIEQCTEKFEYYVVSSMQKDYSIDENNID